MRTTDPDPVPFKPLGERVPRQVVKDAPPPPKDTPRGPYGVVVGPDGMYRTTKEPQ